MSNSRFHNSGKSELSGSTIGFRFHASDEELEELQLDHDISGDKRNDTNLELKLKTALLTSESLENAKSEEEKGEGLGDAVRDHRHLLVKRSTSVDSTYESPFSNPIETWRKLNELKEKITKTVEEKISEMKIDRNVLGKSSRGRLLNSKENSSISDSEDTSESSKVSDWKDAEDLNLSPTMGSRDTSESLSSILESTVENVKMEMKNKETESGLRNRKSSEKVSDIMNIKISMPKSEIQGRLIEPNLSKEGSMIEGIESGVEADENLDPNQIESFNFVDEPSAMAGDGSQNPPSGRNDSDWAGSIISFFISETCTLVLLIAFGFYIFFPMSDFMRGFFLCGMMVAFWERVRYFLRLDDSSILQSKSLIVPDYKSLPPLKVPALTPSKGVWINEYASDYDPDVYSVSHTSPAYLEIDKSILKLSRPKSKIHKRATFDEPDYKLNFTSQRIYNISGCNVILMPEGLTKKRLFSKKYPIVIHLKSDSFIAEKKKGKDMEEKESSELVEGEESFISSPENPVNRTSLCLFARCDRQKEEWYRRLLAATRSPLSPLQSKEEKLPEVTEEIDVLDKEPSTPFENLFFDDDAVYMEEYLRYMSKVIEAEASRPEVKAFKSRISWYKRLRAKKRPVDFPATEEVESLKNLSKYKKPKSSRTSVDANGAEEVENEETVNPFLQIHWFNAFIHRIMFDVFRSPYWLSKIQEKIERKLNSIRLPYYIEDIEVIELDLGKTGPVFHRVSPPHLDDRGLWFYMDQTFDGFIKLTIQTHLNLIKLQKGLEEENASLSTEKPEKGKKKHKEPKDPFLFKDSKVKAKESVNRKIRKFGKSDSKRSPPEVMSRERSPSVDEPHDLGCKSSEEYRLFDEFARLAEIAVEESLVRDKHKELECAAEVSCSKVDEKFEKQRSPIYDSELEDSAESSDEDEDEVEIPIHSHSDSEDQAPVTSTKKYPRNRRSSRRLFRVFENVAQSKYFKSVAQSKYIQRAIAGVSATKLRLTVEIKSCTGTLAVNVPPPPSDRFWYGFRDMPKLVFAVNPKIGDKSVRFVHIKNYLQKKFLHELKKVMVSPNMIDLVLPTSSPGRSPSPVVLFSSPDFEDPEAPPPPSPPAEQNNLTQPQGPLLE